jgi:hypothetical protein
VRQGQNRRKQWAFSSLAILPILFATVLRADTTCVLRANNQQAGVHQMTTFQVTKIVAPYSETPTSKDLGTVQATTSSMARIIAYDQFRQGWNARLVVTEQK